MEQFGGSSIDLVIHQGVNGINNGTITKLITKSTN
jgi:hypothetical protein